MAGQKVPFSEIKKGGFFRSSGKALWQRMRRSGLEANAQKVDGSDIGYATEFERDDLVIPVNATIVEE